MRFFKKKQSSDKNGFDDFPPIGGLMVSKMVVNEKIKPKFLYREKRTRAEDSGWRIFTGLETEGYTDNPNNIGIYNPSTILKIDPSLKDILLKGIGSVYERTEDNAEWYKVADFDLEDDYLTTHKLTTEWTIDINNLFERTIEETGALYYTTGDKSIRLTIWKSDKNQKELYKEYKQYIDSRDQTQSETLDKFEFTGNGISRIGYLIQENDGVKTYDVIYGFSMIDRQIILAAIYVDDKEDLKWAFDTWKSIKIQE